MSDECLITLETVVLFYVDCQAVMRKFTLADATGTGQWHPFIVFELFRVLFLSNVPIVYVMHLFP